MAKYLVKALIEVITRDLVVVIEANPKVGPNHFIKAVSLSLMTIGSLVKSLLKKSVLEDVQEPRAC